MTTEAKRQLIDKALAALEQIVCIVEPDRGVVLLSNYGPCHYDAEQKCQVYDHVNFSPLGDALIALHDLLSGEPADTAEAGEGADGEQNTEASGGRSFSYEIAAESQDAPAGQSVASQSAELPTEPGWYHVEGRPAPLWFDGENLFDDPGDLKPYAALWLTAKRVGPLKAQAPAMKRVLEEACDKRNAAQQRIAELEGERDQLRKMAAASKEDDDELDDYLDSLEIPDQATLKHRVEVLAEKLNDAEHQRNELREAISPGRTCEQSYYIKVAAKMRERETKIKPMETPNVE